MAEAANYLNYYVPSPEEAFLKNSPARFAMAQQEAAEADRRAAQQQKEALQSIRTDRSPENLARVTLLFPDLRKQIADSESILIADQIKSDNSFRAEVISLYKSNPDAARARLAKQAEGYANTPGMEKQAAASQAMLKSYDINPDSVMIPLSIHLAQSDKELYQTMFGADVKLDTTVIKNLIAEGFKPGTPEFQAALKAERETITTTLPGNGFYRGSPAGLAQILGNNQLPTNVQKGPPRRPTTKAEFDKLPPGSFFIDPNGVNRQKLGGQTGTPSGDFQGK